MRSSTPSRCRSAGIRARRRRRLTRPRASRPHRKSRQSQRVGRATPLVSAPSPWTPSWMHRRAEGIAYRGRRIDTKRGHPPPTSAPSAPCSASRVPRRIISCQQLALGKAGWRKSIGSQLASLWAGFKQKVRMRNVAEDTRPSQIAQNISDTRTIRDEKGRGTPKFWRARLGATDELVAP